MAVQLLAAQERRKLAAYVTLKQDWPVPEFHYTRRAVPDAQDDL